jgi:DNA-binding MarR family transcriptional regulator
MPADADTDQIPIPALLRAARGSYGRSINARLAAAEFEDLPRNGAYVLGGMANHGGTAGGLVRGLGISKQAASQLIDTLVLRGYLERLANVEDRRRMSIELTERGRAAAVAVREGVVAVDEELATLISAVDSAGLRAGLIALCDIRDRLEDEARH